MGEEPVLSVRAGILKFSAQLFLNRLLGHVESMESIQLALFKLLDDNPAISFSTPTYVLPAFAQLLQSQMEMGQEMHFRQSLQLFRSMRFLSPSGNANALELGYLLEVQFCLFHNLFNGLQQLEPELMRYFSEFKNKTLNLRQAETLTLWCFYLVLSE